MLVEQAKILRDEKRQEADAMTDTDRYLARSLRALAFAAGLRSAGRREDQHSQKRRERAPLH